MVIPRVIKSIALSGALSGALLVSLMTSVPAKADSVGPQYRSWVDMVRYATREQSRDYQTVEFNPQNFDRLVSVKLAEIAEDQVQVWADTILEGDYLADGEVKIERVNLVRYRGEFIGYQVFYSTHAVDTSECDPSRVSAISSASLPADCVDGRIVEASFVSPDLQSWIRDEHHFAEFVVSLM